MTARRTVIIAATAIVVILVVTGAYYFALPHGPLTTVTIVATEGQVGVAFTPANFTVKEGQQVTLVFVNRDSTPHELVIPAFGVSTQIVNAGSTVSVYFVPNKGGTFIVTQPCGAGPPQDVLPCNIQVYMTVLSPKHHPLLDRLRNHPTVGQVQIET